MAFKNPLTTQCRACKKEIMFIETALYKKIPVDVVPVWVRTDTMVKNTFVLPSGETIKGEQVPETFADEKAPIKLAYISHFATCPCADQFRKPRARKRERAAE